VPSRSGQLDVVVTPVSLAGQALPCIYSTCRLNSDESGRLGKEKADERGCWDV
jgi:hypothetical protein